MESNTKFALQLPKQGFYSFTFAKKKEIKKTFDIAPTSWYG